MGVGWGYGGEGGGGWFGFEDGMREDEEGRKVSREGRQDGKVVLRFPQSKVIGLDENTH